MKNYGFKRSPRTMSELPIKISERVYLEGKFLILTGLWGHDSFSSLGHQIRGIKLSDVPVDHDEDVVIEKKFCGAKMFKRGKKHYIYKLDPIFFKNHVEFDSFYKNVCRDFNFAEPKRFDKKMHWAWKIQWVLTTKDGDEFFWRKQKIAKGQHVMILAFVNAVDAGNINIKDLWARAGDLAVNKCTVGTMSALVCPYAAESRK